MCALLWRHRVLAASKELIDKAEKELEVLALKVEAEDEKVLSELKAASEKVLHEDEAKVEEVSAKLEGVLNTPKVRKAVSAVKVVADAVEAAATALKDEKVIASVVEGK